MPLIGSRCENDPDDLVPSAECLACAASASPTRGRCRMMPELLELIFDRGNRAGAGISATMITSTCLRKSYLEATVDYYALPSTRWPAARGTLLHLLYERATPRPGVIREERFGRKLDGTALTGQIDVLDLNRKLIIDAKTKATMPASVDEMPGYVYQLNLYRWIVADGYSVHTGQPIQAEVAQLGLVVHTMSTVSKFAVPVLSDELLLAWLAPRLATLSRAFQGEPPPPRGLDPLTSRFCLDWCPVRSSCLKVA